MDGGPVESRSGGTTTATAECTTTTTTAECTTTAVGRSGGTTTTAECTTTTTTAECTTTTTTSARNPTAEASPEAFEGLTKDGRRFPLDDVHTGTWGYQGVGRHGC